jgi:hypothetical protein
MYKGETKLIQLLKISLSMKEGKICQSIFGILMILKLYLEILILEILDNLIKRKYLS